MNFTSFGGGRNCPPLSLSVLSAPQQSPWKKSRSARFIAACFLVLLVLSPVSADNSGFPKRTVQLAWFYKPPKDGNLEALVRHFDIFILTKADEEVRDKLKAKGVKVPFLQYWRMDAIEDPGSCNSTPHRNQVAYRKQDFCRISKEHPDWFLLDRDGQRIRADGYYLMDPGNREWREFFLKRVRQSQHRDKWEGVFLDNAEASLIKRRAKNGIPARYKDHASYTAAIEGFLKYIYEAYFRPNNRALWANIISLDNPDVWYRYMQYLDGAMVESFAVDWKDGFRKRGEWEEHLERAERTQNMGKHILLVAQGNREDRARQEFAFASYLLVASGDASFRYSRANHYVYPWIYNNYRLKLGEPLGKRYFGAGSWHRKFKNGSVTVNPRTRRAEIRVN